MLKNSWMGIYLLVALTGIIFIIILISLMPKNTIHFTGLPNSEITAPQIQSTDPVLKASSSWFDFKQTNKKITIFYYSNETCANCVKTEKVLLDIFNEYPDEIQIVWKDFPNPTLNTESLNSAIAARCADKQNNFWGFHKFLIDNYINANDNLYQEIANELNLGMWRFNRCYKNQNTLSLVEASYQEAINFHLTTAPTLYINGNWYSGELTKQELEALIINAQNQIQ